MELPKDSGVPLAAGAIAPPGLITWEKVPAIFCKAQSPIARGRQTEPTAIEFARSKLPGVDSGTV
jgi:hypothetical protein